MVTRRRATAVCAIAAFTLASYGLARSASAAEEVISPQQAADTVTTTGIQVHGGVVSGRVVNHTDTTLRNVKVMVDHAWLWSNERHPGMNDPSRTDFYTVPQAIPPHGSMAFEYRATPPLPQRSDGHFDTVVKVDAFTQLGTQQASR